MAGLPLLLGAGVSFRRPPLPVRKTPATVVQLRVCRGEIPPCVEMPGSQGLFSPCWMGGQTSLLAQAPSALLLCFAEPTPAHEDLGKETLLVCQWCSARVMRVHGNDQSPPGMVARVANVLWEGSFQGISPALPETLPEALASHNVLTFEE